MVWDLSRLQYTVRKLSGKFDTNQLPDGASTAGNVSVANPPGVDDYINDFYMYDFPEHLRTLQLDRYFTFQTVPNVGTYNVPQTIYQLKTPFYVDNYQFAYYEDPDVFLRIWPEFNFINAAIATTNGTLVTYTFTLTQTPIQQGTVVIGLQPNPNTTPAPQLETFTDVDTPILLDQPKNIKFTNLGTLTSNLGGTGTINYLTGAVSITYSTAPPSGININAHYHPYVASRPRDVLFFQQQLFLRPIPNDTYMIKMVAYFMPTAILSSATNATQRPLLDANGNLQGPFNSAQSGGLTDVPMFNEWWECIAIGAAMKILAEEGDWDERDRLRSYFEEQKLLAQRKLIKQMATRRIQTVYGDNAGAAGAQFPVFPIY